MGVDDFDSQSVRDEHLEETALKERSNLRRASSFTAPDISNRVQLRLRFACVSSCAGMGGILLPLGDGARRAVSATR